MRSTLWTLALAALISGSLSAQKLKARNGKVSFFSATPVEDIKAVNNQASSVIDLESGQFAFLVPIKGFTFEKALMQEHFNENYMESSKYSNATFKGKIKGHEEIELSEDGEYEVVFAGTMSMHGEEKEVEEVGTLTVKDGKATLHSEFVARPADYKIEIPSSKRDNISETIDVTVNIEYES